MASAQKKPDRTRMRQEVEEIPVACGRFLDNGRDAVRNAARDMAQDVSFWATVARGSSDHAATLVKYAAELTLGVPVASLGPSVASVYGKSLALKGVPVIGVSQSGKSPDIVSMIANASVQGAKTVAITNNPASPLAENCRHVIDIQAGPELSVAATKTFVNSSVAGLLLVAEAAEDVALRQAIDDLPDRFYQALDQDWSSLLETLTLANSAFLLGRGPSLAIAHEAALKFKETCQLHAEAYSAAEVMHGPVSIVGDGFPVLAFVLRDDAEDATVDVVDSIAARGARVFSTSAKTGSVTRLPVASSSHPLTDALVQLVSFYSFIEGLACHLGLDPDHPRHLRKVTETV